MGPVALRMAVAPVMQLAEPDEQTGCIECDTANRASCSRWACTVAFRSEIYEQCANGRSRCSVVSEYEQSDVIDRRMIPPLARSVFDSTVFAVVEVLRRSDRHDVERQQSLHEFGASRSLARTRPHVPAVRRNDVLNTVDGGGSSKVPARQCGTDARP